MQTTPAKVAITINAPSAQLSEQPSAQTSNGRRITRLNSNGIERQKTSFSCCKCACYAMTAFLVFTVFSILRAPLGLDRSIQNAPAGINYISYNSSSTGINALSSSLSASLTNSLSSNSQSLSSSGMLSSTSSASITGNPNISSSSGISSSSQSSSSTMLSSTQSSSNSRSSSTGSSSSRSSSTVSSSSSGTTQPTIKTFPKARAILVGTPPNPNYGGPGTKMGEITFLDWGNGATQLNVTFRALIWGIYGMHIYSNSSNCTPAGTLDDISFNGHLNPFLSPYHGDRTNPLRHLGDLGNLEMGNTDSSNKYYYVDKVQLSTNPPTGGIINQLVVIEQVQDDLVPYHANAGPGLACGVIQVVS